MIHIVTNNNDERVSRVIDSLNLLALCKKKKQIFKVRIFAVYQVN